ncbi:hypothetical protein H6F47_03465 [Sphaerospermopsis sp. FACHB-1094]|nr:hypothetical protein [Sphaerospermopsis sp. FACHB-1094]
MIGKSFSQLPITNYPLSITNYPLPITHDLNYRSPLRNASTKITAGPASTINATQVN